MQDVRKSDPTFTNFVPRTAAEAVDRYVRCRRNGLKPMLVPECLIACSAALSGSELDKFEQWIISPNDDLSHVKLVPEDSVRAANEAIYLETCKKFENMPPVPEIPSDDEKEEKTWEEPEEIS